jgi:hypothetical protein
VLFYIGVLSITTAIMRWYVVGMFLQIDPASLRIAWATYQCKEMQHSYIDFFFLNMSVLRAQLLLL